MHSFLSVTLCISTVVLSLTMAPGQETGPSPSSAILNADLLDRRVDPCADFYAYACGKWQAQNPVPADQPGWGRFDESAGRSEPLIRGFLEKYAAHGGARSPQEHQLGDYYHACMDEDAIERAGLRPLENVMRAISALQSSADIGKLVAQLHRHGVNVFFSLRPQPDYNDASRMMATLEADGTAVPDRDFYLRNDHTAAVLRKLYLKHIQSMFELLSDSGHDAAVESKAVLNIETVLAAATIDRANPSAPTKTYRKMSVAELSALSPGFGWRSYFDELALPAERRVEVGRPQFFQQMSSELQTASVEDLKVYLRWYLVHAFAGLLPGAFAQEDFSFFGKTLSGARELPQRWKRCVRLSENDLGDAVSRRYVEAALGADDKARVQQIANALQKALGDDIEGLPWMSPSTRQKALQKLRAVSIQIGYPDHWGDDSALPINPADAFGNSWRAREFEFRRQLDNIGKSTDKEDWPVSPASTDASYNDQRNSITFPAGLFQAPFYDSKADDALLFGAIGALIGHEMTHGFDSDGSHFDAQGNVNNWWTELDREEFGKRAQCLEEQYSAYTVVGRLKVNGTSTLNENIADNGGLRLAYMALVGRLAGKEPAPLDGLTASQRFFLGWAGMWCQNRSDVFSREQAAADSHPRGKWRVNGVVSDMPEFQQAFHCRPDAPLVRRNPCRVW